MEKRRHERTEAEHAGRLFNDRLNVPCTLLDVSKSGARVRIAPGLFLPKLLFLSAPDIGKDRPVEIVWRNKTQIGVRF